MCDCDKRYVAIVGMKNYSSIVLKPNMMVSLKKDYANNHDEEAIEVIVENFGKAGYIANSINAVPKGCFSAGRIYDTFDDSIEGIVRFVLNGTAIVELIDDDDDDYDDLEKNFMIFTNIIQDLFSD